jgi:hypothetical protein
MSADTTRRRALSKAKVWAIRGRRHLRLAQSIRAQWRAVHATERKRRELVTRHYEMEAQLRIMRSELRRMGRKTGDFGPGMLERLRRVLSEESIRRGPEPPRDLSEVVWDGSQRVLWLNIYQIAGDRFETDVSRSEEEANQHPNFLAHIVFCGEDTRVGLRPWPIEIEDI